MNKEQIIYIISVAIALILVGFLISQIVLFKKVNKLTSECAAEYKWTYNLKKDIGTKLDQITKLGDERHKEFKNSQYINLPRYIKNIAAEEDKYFRRRLLEDDELRNMMKDAAREVYTEKNPSNEIVLENAEILNKVEIDH